MDPKCTEFHKTIMPASTQNIHVCDLWIGIAFFVLWEIYLRTHRNTQAIGIPHNFEGTALFGNS